MAISKAPAWQVKTTSSRGNVQKDLDYLLASAGESSTWNYVATGGEKEISPPFTSDSITLFRGGLLQIAELGAYSVEDPKIIFPTGFELHKGEEIFVVFGNVDFGGSEQWASNIKTTSELGNVQKDLDKAAEIGLPGGLQSVGICETIAQLRTVIPKIPGRLVYVKGWAGMVRSYYYDASDKTTVDDGGMVVVTQEGQRWKLVRQSTDLPLEIWKTDTNTWDDAVAGLMAFDKARTSSYTKILLPFGRITLTKPWILDYNKSYSVEGVSGHQFFGSVLSFNIPRSVAVANNWLINGCLEHFGAGGSAFRTTAVLNLTRVGITGQFTTPVAEGDEASFAYMHGIKTRCTASTWMDVAVQNFRGAGFWYDNSYDCTFIRTSAFATGRMKPGFDYNNPADVGNADACEYAPFHIMSSRGSTGAGDTDSCNFLSWQSGSIELNNVTPFVDIASGIQLVFENYHAERPGRSQMPRPNGTFMRIGSAEVWLKSCGVSNFVNFIECRGFSQIYVEGCARTSGNWLFNASSEVTNRIKITDSIIGGSFLTTGFHTGHFNISNTEFSGDVRFGVRTGHTMIDGCRFAGDFSVVSGPGNPLASSAGVRLTNSSVQGVFNSDANSQRVSVENSHFRGNFTMLGANCSDVNNTHLGTRVVSKQASNIVLNRGAGSLRMFRAGSLATYKTEILGTVQVGEQIIFDELSGTQYGVVCTSTGTATSGTFAALRYQL